VSFEVALPLVATAAAPAEQPVSGGAGSFD